MQALALDPGGVVEGTPRPELVPGRADDATGSDEELLEPRERPVVLIVDDEASIRLLCRVNLRLEGLDTVEAGDGETALRVARELKPDLILLDVMMPNVDGWQVAAELASDKETRNLPIVFLSARAEPADHMRGYELGAVGYVTKPFDPTALGAILLTVLDRLGRGELEEMRRERLHELGEQDAT
jgi:DNA-binding response OmpR family regulator